MSINITGSVIGHAKSTLKKLTEGLALPFSKLIPKEKIEGLTGDLNYRERIFTPALTIHAFLSQVTSPDQSCQQAVAQVMAHLAQSGSDQALSANTSAYSQARKRLPETTMQTLTQETALELELNAPEQLKWRGRSIKLTDGTNLSMPDTAANQAEYPQPNTQKKGLDFLWPEWLASYHWSAALSWVWPWHLGLARELESTRYCVN